MTRQFDVFHNPSPQSRNTSPYVLVLQSHYVDAIDTAVIAPLVRREAMEPDGVLSLAVEVNNEAFTAAIALIVNIQAKRLISRVGNLRHYEDEIRRALERLFTGF